MVIRGPARAQWQHVICVSQMLSGEGTASLPDELDPLFLSIVCQTGITHRWSLWGGRVGRLISPI